MKSAAGTNRSGVNREVEKGVRARCYCRLIFDILSAGLSVASGALG